MPMQTLHQSANYAAFLHPRAGLIIQSTRKSGPADWPVNKGVQMRPDHPQFAEYVDAFKTALDTIEADALCKALTQ